MMEQYVKEMGIREERRRRVGKECWTRGWPICGMAYCSRAMIK